MLQVERGNLAKSQNNSGYLLYDTVLGRREKEPTLSPLKPCTCNRCEVVAIVWRSGYTETLVGLNTSAAEAIVELKKVSVRSVDTRLKANGGGDFLEVVGVVGTRVCIVVFD